MALCTDLLPSPPTRPVEDPTEIGRGAGEQRLRNREELWDRSIMQIVKRSLDRGWAATVVVECVIGQIVPSGLQNPLPSAANPGAEHSLEHDIGR